MKRERKREAKAKRRVYLFIFRKRMMMKGPRIRKAEKIEFEERGSRQCELRYTI